VGISFGSINTGLPKDIVKQLVDAERIPVKQLEAKKGKAENQLKLVEDLTGKIREINDGLRELGSTRGFQDYKLDTGDPNIISGTVEKGAAVNGTYMVEVVQMARKTSALSNGFPDKDKTEVGVGYFTVKDAQGNKRDVYIDGNNNTLEKLAETINRQNIGVRASVIKDSKDQDTPYKLMIGGAGVGNDKAVDFPTFYFLDGDQDFYIDSERPSQNGVVRVDGVEFEVQDNSLKDVIPGVTLDLRQAAPGREIAVTVKEDKEVITGKVKTFVDKMNAVLGFINDQNKLTKDSDTNATLGGDSSLRNIENRLRQVLQTPVYGLQGSVKSLSDIGISFQRNGLLQFDDNKFNATVSRDLPGVQEFVVGDGMHTGLVPTIRNAINVFLDPSFGALTQREQGIRNKIRQMDDQIASKEQHLAQREEQLKNQFARLEETMSRLKSQGAEIQAKLGGGGAGGFDLSGNGGGGG